MTAAPAVAADGNSDCSENEEVMAVVVHAVVVAVGEVVDAVVAAFVGVRIKLQR